jgi:hypothetical protein
MSNRRDFLTPLGTAAVAWPLTGVAWASQGGLS